MANNLFDKVVKALKQAEQHNSSIMVKPEVILWPDPESQWAEVISDLQAKMPQLLIFGKYEPAKKQGPAIWIKCMVARTLPESNWDEEAIPIIYMPGIAKNDLRNVEAAGYHLQPLLEYQYTGTLFTQDNGKEWTILAFVENSISGLGLQVAKDGGTKSALRQALPAIFQDDDVFTGNSTIDAEYINIRLFPDIIPSILKWMCMGDAFLQNMEAGKRSIFISLCKAKYDFEPDHKNIKAIAEKLGSQRTGWKQVWQMYANAPHKYLKIEELLRFAKPDDLGSGMFALPSESWPQVNEQKEEELSKALEKVSKLQPKEASHLLNTLEQNHSDRRNWVWSELGKTSLTDALQHLVRMAAKATETFPSASIDELKSYYISSGFETDQAMRKSLAAVKSEKDKALIKSLIQSIYKPWLQSITNKFQNLIEKDASPFSGQVANTETESFVLFVDALRFELAEEFCNRLLNQKYKVSLETNWSAIPSLTPTSKTNASPIATMVSLTSDIKDFRPQLQSGKDLQTEAFRDALATRDFKFVFSPGDISTDYKCWQEIGNIDTKGHEEQSGMVKRVEELFEQVQEVLDVAFDKGIKRIKIVTDHGWLLLPGGLPKTQLHEGLTETRWGRCALIKEGAITDLLHLPWRWNPSIFIAYAPGISFFKANQEYAHGGISLHECLVPTMIIENPNVSTSAAKIAEIKWVNLRCAVTTEGAKDGFTIDIRNKYNNSATSILEEESKIKAVKGNKVTLMVSDEAESQAATIVLLDETGRILDKKLTTVGG